MDLHYLRVFNAVASQLNFSKTADELHISQPAVSMQIKKLEEDLGLKLFDRIGKQVYLNQNGELLYRYTKKIFSLISEAEAKLNELKEDISGNIFIGATNTPGIFILPNILGGLKDKFPNVNASLHIGHSEELFEMINNNSLDFAVLGGEAESADNLIVERLFEDEIILIVSALHPFANRPTVTKQELNDEWFITHKPGSPLFKIMQKFAIESLGVPLNISLTIDSTDAIKQAVGANLGVSLIPFISAKKEIEIGTLKAVRIEGYNWKYPYNLVYHPNKYFSPAAEKMIRSIREYFLEIEV